MRPLANRERILISLLVSILIYLSILTIQADGIIVDLIPIILVILNIYLIVKLKYTPAKNTIASIQILLIMYAGYLYGGVLSCPGGCPFDITFLMPKFIGLSIAFAFSLVFIFLGFRNNFIRLWIVIAEMSFIFLIIAPISNFEMYINSLLYLNILDWITRLLYVTVFAVPFATYYVEFVNKPNRHVKK